MRTVMLRRHPAVRRVWGLAWSLWVPACIASLAGCAGDGSPLSVILDPAKTASPSQVARDAFNVYDADVRRDSVALLSSAPFGGEGPYLRLYRLLFDDPDATVRAACVQALGMHGAEQDLRLLIGALERDRSAVVRWEAAKALQKIHAEDAIVPLVQALRHDQDNDVRIAAAYALGQYPEPRVFNALVGALDDTDFGVVQTSQHSLATLTGQDFAPDGRRWLTWADEHRKDLFTGQRPYVWWPYEKPRGFWDKARFWEEPEPTLPRPARGTMAAAPQVDESKTQ